MTFFKKKVKKRRQVHDLFKIKKKNNIFTFQKSCRIYTFHKKKK